MCVLFIMQVLHRTCSFCFPALFWRQRIGGLTRCHTFYIKRILVSHVDGGTQHTLRRFESLLSDKYNLQPKGYYRLLVQCFDGKSPEGCFLRHQLSPLYSQAQLMVATLPVPEHSRRMELKITAQIYRWALTWKV